MSILGSKLGNREREKDILEKGSDQEQVFFYFILLQVGLVIKTIVNKSLQELYTEKLHIWK